VGQQMRQKQKDAEDADQKSLESRPKKVEAFNHFRLNRHI